MNSDPKPSGPDFEAPAGYDSLFAQPSEGESAESRGWGSARAGRPNFEAPGGETGKGRDAGRADDAAHSSYAPPRASQSQFNGQQPHYSSDVNWGPPTSAPSSSNYQPPQSTQPRAGAIPRHVGGKPVVTYSLIGICVVVWLLELISPTFFQAVALVPARAMVEPWRVITAAFAHSISFTHILFNMYALWVLGVSIERFIGGARFLALYLLSALGGNIMYILLAQPPSAEGPGDWYQAVVGASGAVFGLFGALIVFQRALKMSNSAIWVIVGLNVIIGFVVPNIAWQAHLGGFLVGLASAWVIIEGKKASLQGKRDQTWAMLVSILLVLVVGVFVKLLLLSL